MTPFALVQILLEHYDYASTQIALPADLANHLLRWSDLNIPEDILSRDPKEGSKGRETELHVTVKYGLKVKGVTEALRQVARETRPFPILVGRVSLFTSSPQYDVVKLDVESPGLRDLNRRVSDAVPHEDTHPHYHPHVTLAYVQKGTANFLSGDDPFEVAEVDREFTTSGMEFRGAGGEQDVNRVQEPLLFSRTPYSGKVTEAAVQSTRAEMDEIMGIIRAGVAASGGVPERFVAEVAPRLAPHKVFFERCAKHDYGPEAFADARGVFILPPTRYQLQDAFWLRKLEVLIQHELVHVRQMQAMRDPEQIEAAVTAYVAPGGRIDADRYLQQKQEVMAYAATMVNAWQRAGATREQMLRWLRTGENWSFAAKYWHARERYPDSYRRFVKNATEYIAQVQEAARTPDPFSGADFPVQPEDLPRFRQQQKLSRARVNL